MSTGSAKTLARVSAPGYQAEQGQALSRVSFAALLSSHDGELTTSQLRLSDFHMCPGRSLQVHKPREGQMEKLLIFLAFWGVGERVVSRKSFPSPFLRGLGPLPDSLLTGPSCSAAEARLTAPRPLDRSAPGPRWSHFLVC